MMKRLIACGMLVLMLGAMVACGGDDPTFEMFYSPGEAFVTNLAGDTKLLVKANMSLGMSRDETELLTEKNAIVRDCILLVLRAKTAEEMQDVNIQSILSDEITQKLNEIFPADEYGRALFTRAMFIDLVVN